MNIQNKLCTVEQTNELIRGGNTLIIAGDERVLEQLESGNWIGGTIPYFMSEEGGCMTQEKVFVTDLTDFVQSAKIATYGAAEIEQMLDDRFRNGFSYLLIPAFSEIHSKYALEANNHSSLFDIPTMGWITGVDLEEIGSRTPKIVDGRSAQMSDSIMIALHCELAEEQFAEIDIINLFEQGEHDLLEFKEDGFSATDCMVNGKEMNFADYVNDNEIDIRLPLVADYSGAFINTSFQQIDTAGKKVDFYAPVLKNYEYRVAKPVGDYVKEFNAMIPVEGNGLICSCNCILNYLYSELEGKQTGNVTGPITFGEIAYVLVNQTMVTLAIN